MDPSLLGIQLPGASTQVFPQPLPSMQANDAMKFQDMLAGSGGDLADQTGSVRDQPVLQHIGNATPVDGNGSFKEALLDKVGAVDQSYHSIMEQMQNRPRFADYSRESSISELRTYPMVSTSGGEGLEGRLDRMMSSMRKENAAALEYQQDMSSWTMKFQMWSSGVELISSMVSQVSRGFQTLFRASG